MSNDWDWKTATENARDLARSASESNTPEKHVKGLAKAIQDLCDAVEDVAEKSGIGRRGN